MLRVALWKPLTLLIVSTIGASCSNAPSGLKLYVFDCGYVRINDVSVFSPGHNEGQSKDLVDSCYLIQHPSGMLLWDAGLPDSLINHPDGVPLGGLLFLTVKRTLTTQLEDIGVAPPDIEYFALSHMHFDHVGNANTFASSTLLVQDDEYQAAFLPEADTSYYYELRQSSTMRLSGDHDVFGDSSVVIMSAPGHTPGHQVLFIDLPETGPIVLSGDLYHFTDNRVHRRMPSFNYDRELTLQSMDRIEAFVAEKNAILWIQHDLEQNADIPHAPAFVN